METRSQTSISLLRRFWAFKNRAMVDGWLETLRRLGLPE